MLITKLKSKVAYAKVTQTELFYVGSITIDENIMNRAVLSENENVLNPYSVTRCIGITLKIIKKGKM